MSSMMYGTKIPKIFNEKFPKFSIRALTISLPQTLILAKPSNCIPAVRRYGKD